MRVPLARAGLQNIARALFSGAPQPIQLGSIRRTLCAVFARPSFLFKTRLSLLSNGDRFRRRDNNPASGVAKQGSKTTTWLRSSSNDATTYDHKEVIMKRVRLAALVFATTLFAIPALSHAQVVCNLHGTPPFICSGASPGVTAVVIGSNPASNSCALGP